MREKPESNESKSQSDRFSSAFDRIVSELGRLLEVEFFTADQSSDRPLETMLRRMQTFHTQGHYVFRDQEYGVVNLLVKNLAEIEQQRPELLNRYRRGLTDGELGHYMGARLEVQVAASLLKNRISFESPDPPDFVISVPGNQLFIECTSTNLLDPKPGNLVHKVIRAIKNKANKSYAIPSTALFVDRTNIEYHMLDNGSLDCEVGDDSEFIDEVNKILREVDFGSILLCSYKGNLDLGRFEWDSIRIDNARIDPSLARFLNNYFPHGDSPSYTCAIPTWG